jgi:serine/threonine-protein kinase RsbT
MMSGPPGEPCTITIRADVDIVSARRLARQIAVTLPLSRGHVAMVATTVSELARNILQYADEGELELRVLEKGLRRGVVVVARDRGPGIANLELALRDGFSTSGGLGLGLPGTRRLMDEFAIESRPGMGTTVTATKWAPTD